MEVHLRLLGNVHNWQIQHNVHHTTNIQVDEDLDAGRIIRFTKNANGAFTVSTILLRVLYAGLLTLLIGLQHY
jgi:hypothetical protein